MLELLISLVALAALLAWVLFHHGRLLALREACQGAWQDLLIEYEGRLALIRALHLALERIGYTTAAHGARYLLKWHAFACRDTPAHRLQCEALVAGMLPGLLEVAVAHPLVAQDPKLLALVDECQAANRRIELRLRDYNHAAVQFNLARLDGRGNRIVSGLLGLGKAPVFLKPADGQLQAGGEYSRD